MRFSLGVVALAALHFVISFFVAFAAGISDSQSWKIAATVLTFPLEFIPSSFALPGPLTWLPWITLSLIWGLGLGMLIRAVTDTTR